MITMDDLGKEKLKKNFEYIVENTTNFAKILTLFIQNGIIDTREREALESGKTQYDRNKDLYILAMKKCPLETLLQCLEGSSNQHIAKKLRSTKILHEPEKSITHGIITLAPCYTGREEEIQKVYKLWEQHKNGNGVPFISIHGPNGVGKILLANDFFRLFRENIKGNCIYINAETIQSATEGFRTLAKKLQISLWDVDHREKVLATLALDIYQSLCKTPSVLVLGNFEDYEQPLVNSFVHVFRNNKAVGVKSPFVILLSQYEPPQMNFEFEFQVKLSPMLGEINAVKLFTENFPVAITIQDEIMRTITKLCQVLLYHPLAIELARRVVFISKVDSSLEAELSRYIADMEHSMNSAETQDVFLKYELDDFDSIGYLAWKMSWKRILENVPENLAIKTLFNATAFFSADIIQVSFLFRLLKSVEVEENNCLSSALEILLNYSLVTPEQDNGGICVRKSMLKFARLEMESEDAVQETLTMLLSAMYEQLKNKNLPVSQISHVISTWNHSTKNKTLVERYAELPVWICLNLFKNGRWEDALNFAEDSSEILNSILGKGNQWTLRILYWKGRIHFERGVYVDSMIILKDVFEKQVLLKYVHHSLITAHRVALIFWKQGDKEKSLEWLRKTLRTRLSLFGEEHKNTQFVKNDMAWVLNSMDEFEKARKLFEEVYTVRVRILGKDHPETVMAKFQIGNLLWSTKRLNEALGIFKEVKEIREKILDPDHPDTVRVKHFMALAYKGMGRWRVGLPLAKEVYEKRVKLLGLEHPYTNYTRNLVRQFEQNLDRINRPSKC